MYSMPELLSPAGSLECVIAAVENGCSAVYAGVGKLNARQGAKNFTESELERAVDYCHIHGARLYAAANVLIKDNETDDFLKLAETAYLMGADGIIVQDMGGASLIKEHFPDFYLLGSTQMTVHDADGANFLYTNGFNRIILSRELSINEIADIAKSTKADIECFVHGALCVSYSGQCLMSSFIGGRSGNRGMCAQPCRHMYSLYENGSPVKEGSLLSLKDLCALNYLPELIKAGVKSFKIEGRMKSPEYVAGVTAIYRKYIDMLFEKGRKFEIDESDIKTLLRIFNRSGFTNGYLTKRRDISMITDNKVGNTGYYLGTVQSYKNGFVSFTTNADVAAGDGIEVYADEGQRGGYITKNIKAGAVCSVKIENDGIMPLQKVYRTYDKKLTDSLKASYNKSVRKINIQGALTVKRDMPISLTVSYGDVSVKRETGLPIPAENKPLTHDEAIKRISKTGNTPFVFSGITAHVDDGLFVTVSQLNELRRTAITALQDDIIKSYKRQKPICVKKAEYRANTRVDESKLAVLVKNEEQLAAVSEFKPHRVYIDFDAPPKLINKIKASQKIKCLPYIERANRQPVELAPYDGYLVRTYGQAGCMVKRGIPFCVDYTLNIFNSRTAFFWISQRCSSFCISPELDMADADKAACLPNSEIIVYGKLQVMTSAQCLVGNFAKCAEGKLSDTRFTLASSKDEYDIITNCEQCYCQLVRKKPLIVNCENGSIKRVQLHNENFKECKDILKNYV